MLSGLNEHPVELTMETRYIETAPSMTFDVSVSGRDGDPIVPPTMLAIVLNTSSTMRFRL
jgi:hypothetical protein